MKCTIWWRFIRWRGQKLGLPDGMAKPLRRELGHWCRHYQIPTKSASFNAWVDAFGRAARLPVAC